MLTNGFDNSELIACIPRLRSYAQKLRGFDSDDLVQQTLLHALEKRHLYRPIKPLLNWLVKMMHNLNTTNMRKIVLHRERDAEHIVDDFQEEQATLALQIRDIKREIGKLHPSTQRLIMSICINEHSYEHAGIVCDMPLGTVRSRLSRTRIKLREAVR